MDGVMESILALPLEHHFKLLGNSPHVHRGLMDPPSITPIGTATCLNLNMTNASTWATLRIKRGKMAAAIFNGGLFANNQLTILQRLLLLTAFPRINLLKAFPRINLLIAFPRINLLNEIMLMFATR
jgi:hypothetical protein